MSQEFRLKYIDEKRNYFFRRNKAKWINEQKAQKRLYKSKLYWTLSCLASTISGCISISAFACLFGVLMWITSSEIGLKRRSIAAGIKMYKSMIKKKRKRSMTK